MTGGEKKEKKKKAHVLHFSQSMKTGQKADAWQRSLYLISLTCSKDQTNTQDDLHIKMSRMYPFINSYHTQRTTAQSS